MTNSAQIDWAELQPTLVKKLGNGSFGQVYEAYLHSAPMAVKVIKMDNDEDNLKLKLIRFKCEPPILFCHLHLPALFLEKFFTSCLSSQHCTQSCVTGRICALCI